MPISSPVVFRRIAQDEFNAQVYDLMSVVFKVHNDFGPDFFNEVIYRNAIALYGRDLGRETATEVPIRLSFGGYLKEYFIDLLFDESILFEAKATDAIHPSHRMQTLNYLLLAGLAHGKIVNMRPPKVQHEFVSTSLTAKERYDFNVIQERWRDTGVESRRLRELFLDLVSEWGTFLPANLYYSAIEHFFGGPNEIVGAISITEANRVVGMQQVHRLNEDVGFRITALTKKVSDYERRLRRFLRFTDLRALHWINLNHSQVVLCTICADEQLANHSAR